MIGRRRARRLALQGLCCLDVRGAGARGMADQFVDDSREDPDVLQGAKQLLHGTFDARDRCDQVLVRHARHWDLGRLALVDRNILRLAVFELLSASAPYKVVISEALRLAEEFSSAESTRFINGILDAAARELLAQSGEQAGMNTDKQDENGDKTETQDNPPEKNGGEQR